MNRKPPRSKFSVYEVYLKKDELGGYFVECLTLPECRATGKDEAEALKNIKDAILECLKLQSPIADRTSNRRFVIVETKE
ncbi:MAG: type II toxin-antitoxin system HicB family antitoxin [Methanoregulaceae archaeon]|nr:type II toxin-antitoxin system HicB family antitoxin [Methanoregulaceae archaeon]